MKNNLEYYRHEVTSHNHWKFKTLRRKYGWAGEGKFWALNNIIADSDFCILDISDDNKLLALSVELDFEKPEFIEFINYLSDNCRLISFTENKISTTITQENLKEVAHKRERQRDWKRHKPKAENTESTSTLVESTVNEEVSTEKTALSLIKRKGKESKGKEIEGEGAVAPPKTKTFKNWSKDDFVNDIQTYKQIYPKDTLNAFFKYWVEKSASGRMRFQREDTWETNLRLDSWARREEKFNKTA